MLNQTLLTLNANFSVEVDSDSRLSAEGSESRMAAKREFPLGDTHIVF